MDEKIIHKRKLNNRVWIEDICKLFVILFIFVIIDRFAMRENLIEGLPLMLIGTIGQIGYIILTGIKLLEHDNPKYWIYTKIESE